LTAIVLLPGMDGSGALFSEFVAALPPENSGSLSS
jgi:hypothetical protein